MRLAKTLSAIAALAFVVPGIAVSQDMPASIEGLQPAPQPFTFTVPSIPQPARFAVPDQPVAETVSLSDVEVIEGPAQSKYQPENSNLDLLDQGKRFDISCIIGKDGGMTDCEAGPNDIRDPNFVEIALNNVSQTVVGPVAADGQPTEGRVLLVTAHFERADKQPANSDLAMNGSD
ncbi:MULTISPECIES: hypothetical protein [Asticcacaulis]|uniref:hypothetical protein n=1 Tax=Asticcacaulis TaxID=76890 RepID=UPI001AE5C28C|nr:MULTISPECIES: hypothetical protein [Asticcacaulis]MBP2158672.1 hypothetical protein [Asticcacaulis solisilvae]MDR6799718.1 hypothetical protein [Asticcacaulis sp. BE141]